MDKLIGFPILSNRKLDIDVVDNPEGLPFIDLIVRDISSGKIIGWFQINKEQTQEIIKNLSQLITQL